MHVEVVPIVFQRTMAEALAESFEVSDVFALAIVGQLTALDATAGSGL